MVLCQFTPVLPPMSDYVRTHTKRVPYSLFALPTAVFGIGRALLCCVIWLCFCQCGAEGFCTTVFLFGSGSGGNKFRIIFECTSNNTRKPFASPNPINDFNFTNGKEICFIFCENMTWNNENKKPVCRLCSITRHYLYSHHLRNFCPLFRLTLYRVFIKPVSFAKSLLFYFLCI